MTDLSKKMSQLEGTADKLSEAVGGLSFASLVRRPDIQNWAPLEIICHMRDYEEIFLYRLRAVLELNDYEFPVYDVDRWAIDRQYLRNDPSEAVSAFRRRRSDSLEFLKSLKPEQWQRSGIHIRLGRMTIEDQVKMMTNHDENHLKQLKQSLGVQV
jgi:hypothetical protein